MGDDIDGLGAGASDNELGPSSEQLLEVQFKNRRRRVMLGVVGALLVGGGAIAGVVVMGKRRAKAQASDAASALSMCLFGDAGPGDAPGARLRASQLGSMGLPAKDRGAVEGVAWPQRCEKHAQDLVERAKDAGFAAAGSKDLGYWADQLAKKIKAPDAQLGDASEPVEAVFKELKNDGLEIHAAKVDGPPAIASAPTIDDLVKTSLVTKDGFPLKELELEKSPGRSQFALVQDATITPSVFLCDFQEQGIECAKLPDPIAKAGHGLKLLGTTDDGAMPLVFEGNHGDAGIYRSDTGEKVAAFYAAGGSSLKSRTAMVLGYDEARSEAFVESRLPGEKASKRLPVGGDFEVANATFASQLLWGAAVVPAAPKQTDDASSDSGDAGQDGDAGAKKKKKKEKKVDDARQHADEPGMYLFPIDDKTGVPGAPTWVAPLPHFYDASDEAHVIGCRTDQATAIVVWGAEQGDSLTFRIGDGPWTAPIAGIFRGSLSCDGTVVAITRAVVGSTPWDGEIDETRCTSAQCEPNAIELKKIIPGGLELAPRSNLIDTVEVDGSLVVAWAAGDRGGVRVRAAPSRDIQNAKDAIALDDLVVDGKPATETQLSDMRLVHAPKHAVLLLSTKRGVVALRVDPSGAVSAEKVTWR